MFFYKCTKEYLVLWNLLEFLWIIFIKRFFFWVVTVFLLCMLGYILFFARQGKIIWRNCKLPWLKSSVFCSVFLHSEASLWESAVSAPALCLTLDVTLLKLSLPPLWTVPSQVAHRWPRMFPASGSAPVLVLGTGFWGCSCAALCKAPRTPFVCLGWSSGAWQWGCTPAVLTLQRLEEFFEASLSYIVRDYL